MRDNSISIAKAIAIMLMVLAHTQFSDYGNKVINMFHMPLFFFFSGYCIKEKYFNATVDFIKKRISGLYKPYVKWSIAFLIVHNLFYWLNIYNNEYGFRGHVSHLYTWQEFVYKFIKIITSMSGEEQLLGGYRFLKSLFVCSIVGFFIIKYNKKTITGCVLLLFLTIVLQAFNLHVPYWGIGAKETFAAIFFCIGHSYKKYNIKLHEQFCILPLGLIAVIIGELYWQGSLLSFKWYNVLPYTLTAILGILAVYHISKYILKIPCILNIFIYIGDNTLTILTWHFLCFKLVSLLIIFLYKLPIERLAEFPAITEYSQKGWFIAYFFMGVFIPLIMAKNKYMR